MSRETDPRPARAAGIDLRPIDDLLAPLDVTIWAVDRELRVTVAGGAGIQRLGARPEELIGLRLADVFRLDDGHPFLAAITQALAGECVAVNTEWGQRRFQVRLAPLRNTAGEVFGCTGISTPMLDGLVALPVALDESAERLRRLVEASPIGVVRAHVDGRLIEANDNFLDMLGYTREDLASERIDWNQRTPSEYLPLDIAAVEEAVRLGRSRPYEKEYWRRDGSRVPVLVTLARMPGRIHEGIASILDLTPRKRLEQHLRSQVAAAAALSRAGSLPEAAPDLLRSIGETLGWDEAALWKRDGDTDERRRTVDSRGVRRFVDAPRLRIAGTRLGSGRTRLERR